jgi:hypothetical protein
MNVLYPFIYLQEGSFPKIDPFSAY